MHLKRAEIKANMLNYLDSHLSYQDDNYKVAFFTEEKGLYSGIVQSKGRLYGFVIDFSGRDFFIEGITGKRLKESAANLTALFPTRMEDVKSVALQKLYNIGMLLGSINLNWGYEADNVGRGLLRAIKEHPIAELIAFMPWVNKSNGSYSGYQILLTLEKKYKQNQRQNDNRNSSLRGITGLSKRHFKAFIKTKSVKAASDILDAGEAKLKLFDNISDIIHQVDKERGYHDADRYMETVIDSLAYDWDVRAFNALQDRLEEPRKQNFNNLIRYLYASCYHQQALPFSQACAILRDYWNFIDLTKGVTKYPRYLKTAHDVASQNYKVVKDMHNNFGVYENYCLHKHFEMVLGDYAFIVAVSGQEISDEANQQSNCVAGYIKAVANKDTLIMFMRDKDDMEHSQVTFEIQDKAIVQAYATYDQPLSEKQSQALMGFAKFNNLEVDNFVSMNTKATPKPYRKALPVIGFHDEAEVKELKGKVADKVAKLESSLTQYSATVKSA